jgi:hypothetical protein
MVNKTFFLELMKIIQLVKLLVFIGWAVIGTQAFSATSDFVGEWVVDDSLSDNTDDRVEAAIKAGGGKVARRFLRRRPEDFYRGGPPEQELYDHISYDDFLKIEVNDPAELRFYYDSGFVRIMHTDGRRRSSGAASYYSDGLNDFSFANWEKEGGLTTLIVEARPRDGGFTLESYALEDNGSHLRVIMRIEPDNFNAPIELTRVYRRK